MDRASENCAGGSIELESGECIKREERLENVGESLNKSEYSGGDFNISPRSQTQFPSTQRQSLSEQSNSINVSSIKDNWFPITAITLLMLILISILYIIYNQKKKN